MASERMYEYYLDWPRWVALLPDAVLRREPESSLRLAWVLLRTGQGGRQHSSVTCSVALAT
jgi:hypothetical protein